MKYAAQMKAILKTGPQRWGTIRSFIKEPARGADELMQLVQEGQVKHHADGMFELVEEADAERV